jgi:hypothetical protein
LAERLVTDLAGEIRDLAAELEKAGGPIEQRELERLLKAGGPL